MPPTESTLLTHFLLPPAPLPTSLPPEKFTTLFPTPLHTSPSLKTLYQDLHSQQTTAITLVRKNIAAETERGAIQRRELRRERRRRRDGSSSITTGIISSTTTTTTTTPNESGREGERQPHTPQTLPAALKTAHKVLSSEIAALEAETRQVLREMRTAVGELSDLRYGRFAKTPGSDRELREEVVGVVGKVREGAEGVGTRGM
ncbi:hypothetical protein BLS_002426 [Venturia inaequalis]|uniref:Uncharacterized protein n=1 Tax=Venturia inaequalis TaxID=5025 RepID=A0A8H3VAY2_VENIN|nr:hypothetical protein BLS_002426 [Venturia inaequalis]